MIILLLRLVLCKRVRELLLMIAWVGLDILKATGIVVLIKNWALNKKAYALFNFYICLLKSV